MRSSLIKFTYGYWLENLVFFLYVVNVMTSLCGPYNALDANMPQNWPCEWNNGVIPFSFDFFSLSPKRLVSLVRKGLNHIEERSCLVFKEYPPTLLAHRPNFTYLFYTYSEVLENCCLSFFTKPIGRRLMLITPICTLPAEVAHATLHGLGLTHIKSEPIPDYKAMAVMFPKDCLNIERKIIAFNKRTS